PAVARRERNVALAHQIAFQHLYAALDRNVGPTNWTHWRRGRCHYNASSRRWKTDSEYAHNRKGVVCVEVSDCRGFSPYSMGISGAFRVSPTWHYRWQDYKHLRGREMGWLGRSAQSHVKRPSSAGLGNPSFRAQGRAVHAGTVADLRTARDSLRVYQNNLWTDSGCHPAGLPRHSGPRRANRCNSGLWRLRAAGAGFTGPTRLHSRERGVHSIL